MFYGKRLKKLRESRGITHQELADLLGVSYAQIYRYEANKTDPSTDVLVKLGQLFGVSVEYLLGMTDDESRHLSQSDLSPNELIIIEALRRGDLKEAIKVIASEE